NSSLFFTFRQNLEIVQELADMASVGRACGNLGNTYYLLGDFKKAIHYHERRLAIAKEFGDRSAERRAYTNLGNAYIFLGEFENAAEHYHKTLQIAKQLLDKALEAQACYSLGNTYTLLRDYEKAIEFHLRHLEIAQQLADKVGEGRACWSLGNAYTALGNHEKALQFTSKHLHISKEIGDENGQISAQMNLADLRNLLGIVDSSKHLAKDNSKKSERNGLSNSTAEDDKNNGLKTFRTRRFSMENMELMKLTPDNKANAKQTSQSDAAGGDRSSGARPKTAKFQRAATVATENACDGNHLSIRPVARPKSAELISAISQEKPSEGGPDDDGFFDLLSRTQGRRIDDQRCSFRVPKKTGSTDSDTPSSSSSSHHMPSVPEVPRKSSPTPGEEFLDMIAGLQSSRMNDQRASLPQFPGLTSRAVIRPYLEKKKDDTVPDDKFFDMLMRCQKDEENYPLLKRMVRGVQNGLSIRNVMCKQSLRNHGKPAQATCKGGLHLKKVMLSIW
ncbi:G-protein-signaling modulator 2, partial [Octopus bimaculoides]